MTFEEIMKQRIALAAMRSALSEYYPAGDVAEFSEAEVVDTYRVVFGA